MEIGWVFGGMDYRNVGYSNIRIPEDDKDYTYKYDYRANTFPEEVFVHEFLHTLERNAEEYGYEVPALHDSSRYGYQSEPFIRLKNWYQDYMNREIDYQGAKIGLPAEIYAIKPVKTSNFEFSNTIEAFAEPDSILEEIQMMFGRVWDIFQGNKT